MKLFILLCILASCQSKSGSNVDPQKIVGRWNLIGTQEGQRVLTKTVMLDYNYGELMASFNYHIIENDMLSAVDQSNGEIYKYRIIKLTNDSLILLHIQSHHVLKYIRTK